MALLGGDFKRDMKSLSDAYASMYEGLDQARKNVGADSCWDGYKAKGTKKKGGKEVPNCVKENQSQLDEVGPLAALAPLAGKVATGLTAKVAGAGATKVGGTVAKAASTDLGKKAITTGSQAVGKKVANTVSNIGQKDESAYSVSVEDGIALEEGKKDCKDGYKYDKEKKKCVKKDKKSSKTTIIVGRGYGGHHHHHDHDDDKEDGGGGDGGTGGGDGGGDGGGGGGE